MHNVPLLTDPGRGRRILQHLYGMEDQTHGKSHRILQTGCSDVHETGDPEQHVLLPVSMAFPDQTTESRKAVDRCHELGVLFDMHSVERSKLSYRTL